ncbi:LIM domain only protein 7-like, partial [Arapaima gigas]
VQSGEQAIFSLLPQRSLHSASQEVTRKTFSSGDFRSALENGVLLCDLINRIKPGIIKRVNRLSTPIAGLWLSALKLILMGLPVFWDM